MVTASAQETESPVRKLDPGIQKLLDTLQADFDRGDAKGLADCWTTSGDFTGPHGRRVVGRKEIEKAFTEHFATHKDGSLKVAITDFRSVSPEVVLVDAATETKSPTSTSSAKALISLVVVKRDANWLIENARETQRREVSPGEHLDALRWMVGDWANESAGQDGPLLTSSCGWTANHAFLIRRFKIEGKQGITHAGTEVIGWDPDTHRIRSWVFDFSGGFGENSWIEDGNRWIVTYSGKLPNGGQATANYVITVVDPDTITLLAKDRTIDGQREPDLPAITLKRQKTPAVSEPESPKTPPKKLLP